jgi:O-antigen/teichoic acid export membrane protein
MSTIRKMASNTFYMFLSYTSTTLLSLLYFIIAGKFLTPHEYGVANTIIQFSTLISMFSSLGLTNAALKLVSEYYETKKMERLYACIKYCFKILLIVNVAVTILIFLISPQLTKYIFKDSSLVSTFLLSAFIILTFSLTLYFGSILYGLGKVKIYFLTEFLINFTKLMLAIILIIYFKLGFFGPIIGYLLGLVFSSLIRFNEIEFKNKYQADKKAIWNYALPALFSTTSNAILTTTPVLILSSFSSTTEAGIFSLVNALASLLMFVPSILYTASFPVFSGMHGKKDHKGIEELLNMIFRYILLISIPLCLIFVMFPEFLIRIVAKTSYLPGAKALSLLGVVGLVYGIGNILLNTLYALGKPKLNRNIMIGTLAIYLLLSVPLSMFYGSFGMAATYLIAFFFLFSSSLFFTRKLYKLNINYKYILKVLLSSSVWLLVLITATFLSNSIYVFIFAGLVGFFLYVILLFVIRTFNLNDLKLLDEFKKIFPKRFSFIFKFWENLIKKFL